MARKLLKRGAHINYVNRNGNTVLHLCVQRKLPKATNFLLDRDANPHIMDLQQKDSCDMAKDNGFCEVVPKLMDVNPHRKVQGKPGMNFDSSSKGYGATQGLDRNKSFKMEREDKAFGTPSKG